MRIYKSLGNICESVKKIYICVPEWEILIKHLGIINLILGGRFIKFPRALRSRFFYAQFLNGCLLKDEL